LRNDLFRIIKKEMEETEDWVSLAGALGACDIHPFRATNEQISSVAREIEKDERLLKAFYHMPRKPVFKKESPEFKSKVEELLRTEDPNTRMDIMVNLLIDVRE